MTRLAWIFLLVWLAGCQSMRLPEAGRVETLMQRGDFAAARTAAPEWCRAALKAVADAEAERDTLTLTK